MAEYIERKIATNVVGDIDTTNPSDDKDDIIEKAIGCLDRIPAADVVPVVRGKWIAAEDPFMNTVYDCSACKETFCFIEGDPRENLYSYCPNCGADMRGAEDE